MFWESFHFCQSPPHKLVSGIMSLPLQDSVFFARKESHLWRNYTFSIVAELRHIRRWPTRSTNISQTEYCSDEAKERIKKLLRKPEISVSPYDTAWVAMVPSPHSPMKPFFPECLNWLLENQCPDGSWACAHHHHLLHKDIISSTLACIIALKKWAVGEEQMQRGIHFIQSSFDVAFDEHQITPLGFDILFPSMLEYASSLSLNMNLQPDKLNSIRRKRDVQLKRFFVPFSSYHSQSVEMELHMAYLAEGTGKSLDWERVMKYQWKNGSLFNCPSTTAAAFIELPNTNCLNYLQSAVKKFGNAVSHTFPLDTFCKLYTVDILESLGISRFFEREIEDVLDETYRGWLRGDEEIFMDSSACSLAFRLLRMHGYHVTSDHLVKSIQDWFSTSNGPVKDNRTVLEWYKASQLVIYPDELELGKQNLRLKRFLELSISSGSLYSAQLSQNIDQEVKRALQYPFYAIIDGIAKRTNIEHYKLTNTRILKTTYCSPNFACEEFLSLALEDFNNCQQTHRDEVLALESWVINNELDKLKFARQKSVYCYFSVAASIFSPELSDARLSWAKNAILTTVVDDFFDFGGSIEELENLIHLVEVWNVDMEAECCSKNVTIIFLALKHMVQEIGDKCYSLQERDVINHIIQIWLDLLYSMMKEAEWSIRKTIPAMDDYIQNAYTSFALGPIVLPTLYLIGPKLTESMVQHPEYLDLFRSTSICGRLLNDIRSCDREMKEDTLNAVQLLITSSNGEITKEMAIESIRNMIRMAQMELLRIVVEKSSVIPKPCKEVFLHMVKVVHFFYSKDDGFSSDNMMETARKTIYEPIPGQPDNEGQEIGTSITNIDTFRLGSSEKYNWLKPYLLLYVL